MCNLSTHFVNNIPVKKRGGSQHATSLLLSSTNGIADDLQCWTDRLRPVAIVSQLSVQSLWRIRKWLGWPVITSPQGALWRMADCLPCFYPEWVGSGWGSVQLVRNDQLHPNHNPCNAIPLHIHVTLADPNQPCTKIQNSTDNCTFWGIPCGFHVPHIRCLSPSPFHTNLSSHIACDRALSCLSF